MPWIVSDLKRASIASSTASNLPIFYQFKKPRRQAPKYDHFISKNVTNKIKSDINPLVSSPWSFSVVVALKNMESFAVASNGDD